MFDFFNNRLFDLNRDGKVDIFEKAFVYHTLFEDDDKNVSRNDDYDDDDYDDDDVEYAGKSHFGVVRLAIMFAVLPLVGNCLGFIMALLQ